MSNSFCRRRFVRNVIRYLRTYGFDGLDMDWEFPGTRGSPKDDKYRFTYLLQVSATNSCVQLRALVSFSGVFLHNAFAQLLIYRRLCCRSCKKDSNTNPSEREGINFCWLSLQLEELTSLVNHMNPRKLCSELSQKIQVYKMFLSDPPPLCPCAWWDLTWSCRNQSKTVKTVFCDVEKWLFKRISAMCFVKFAIPFWKLEMSLFCSHVDYMLLMAYNYHGSWSNRTGHHSGLYPRADETDREREFNQVWQLFIQHVNAPEIVCTIWNFQMWKMLIFLK